MQNFRAVALVFIKILHFKDLGDTSVVSECSLGVNLVVDNFFDVASDTLRSKSKLLYCALYIFTFISA